MKNKSLVNKHFDKVFVINMEHETEKAQKVISQFDKLNIDFEFINGINGYSEEFAREWLLYKNRPQITHLEKLYNKKFIESQGAWGYLKTMIYILSHSIQKKYEKIAVFENDCFFDKNFESKYADFYKSVKASDWKLLLFGASDYGLSKEPSSPCYFPEKLHTCGSFALGIDKSVFYEILQEALRMETNFDNLPLGNIYERYKTKCFVSYPNIVIADVRTSSIRGARDIVKHSQTLRWQLNNFEIE